MASIREQLIKSGHLVANFNADAKVGKTAAKRAKRFKAAAEARQSAVAEGKPDKAKAGGSAAVKKAKSR